MPNTVNKALNTPNTGDLPGAWGTTAVNANMSAIDGMFGGFLTLSLSSATTIPLTAPAGSITPGDGPTQQQNGLIRFTGTLTGDALVQFTLPGFYIVGNQATVGAFVIKLQGLSGGNVCCAPPGRKCHIFYDGTDVDYCDMPEVGSALDLHSYTSAVPRWITASSPAPYLLKDGTIYSHSEFPALGAQMGSTWGGDGSTTFGIPDERNRFRVPIDPSGGGRITIGGSGIDGASMGIQGGSQLAPLHNHTASANVTDPGHRHTETTVSTGTGGTSGVNIGNVSSNTGTASTGITVDITVDDAGLGTSGNMPPTQVSIIALIKT